MYRVILYSFLLLFLYSCASNSRVYTPTHVEYGAKQNSKINEKQAKPKEQKNIVVVHKIEKDFFFDVQAGGSQEAAEEISFELVAGFDEMQNKKNKQFKLNQQEEAKVLVNGNTNSERVIVDLKSNNNQSKLSREEKRKDFEKQISQIPSGRKIHIVQSGDTLYFIARKYNLTLNQLVKMNNINSNYSILVGQKIVVAVESDIDISNLSKFNKTKSKTIKSDKSTQSLDDKKDKFNQVAGVNIYQYKPKLSKFGWGWPMMKSILNKSSKNSLALLAQGITLQSSENQNVYAAKAGQVIFSKKYLNYGLTILIKHDDNFISVYSFLRGIRVKLKQKVKVGEHIGHIGAGSTLTDSILYFEIREGGKPVNPLKYLSKL